MRFAVFLVVAGALPAQSLRPTPRGVQQFEVQGVFEGMPMDPWRSETEMRDSVQGRNSSIVVREHEIHNGQPFDHVALITPDGRNATRADWVNAGREPSQCHLTFKENVIEGSVSLGDLLPRNIAAKPVAFSGDAVPDFAIPWTVALRQLNDGDSLKLTVVRCLPHWNDAAIQTIRVNAVVHTGKAPRAAGAPDEAVWITEGSREYPFVIVVAKSDGQLFSATMPEGTVGSRTLLYRGSRK